MPKYVLTCKAGEHHVRVEHAELPKDATLGPKAEGGQRVVKVVAEKPVTIEVSIKAAGEIASRWHNALTVAGVAPVAAVPVGPPPITKKPGK